MQLDLSLRWRFNQTITKVTVYRPERHTAVACRGSWSSSWWISKSMLDHCPVVYPNLISVSLSWLNASFLHAKFAKSQWNLFLPAYKDAANDKISSVHQHSETVQPPQSVKASSSCSAVMWVFCFLLSICANLWRCHRYPLLWILKDISESGNCSLTFYIFFNVHNSCHSYTVTFLHFC